MRLSLGLLVAAVLPLACVDAPATSPLPAVPESPAVVSVFPDDALAGVDPDTLDPVRARLHALTRAHGASGGSAPPDTAVAVELTQAVAPQRIRLTRNDGTVVDADAQSTLGGRGVLLRPRAPLLVGRTYDVLFDDEPVASFTVSTAPTALLDVKPEGAGTGPWPSAFSVDAEGRTLLPALLQGGDGLSMPVGPVDAAVAEVPGFSTSARARVPLSGVVDDTTGFALVAPDGTVLSDVEATTSPDGTTVMLRRHPALLPATTYAIVVTDDARAGALPVAPSVHGALLLATAPLAVDGRSTVALLDDATAARLEAARIALAPILDGLDSHTQGGTPRDRISLAVPFTTIDAFAFVERHTKLAAERGVEPELSDVNVETPFARGLFAVMPNVDTVVTGRFTGLDFLDPTTLRKSDAGPRVHDVPFVLTIPPDVEGPVPVVIFGHGLITAKELAYLMADDLAQAGFATFAIDFPMHGERTVCLEDLHCSPFSRCGDDHQCTNDDGERRPLAEGVSVFDGGPRIPLATGQAFILVEDLVASRDHVLQGVVDLHQAIRLLQSDRLDGVVEGVAFAHDDLSWAGISLGGIYGALTAGTHTAVDNFVLNVPGADFALTLQESSVLSVKLDAALDRAGLERGSEAFRLYEDLTHAVLDPVDTMNLAGRATVQCPDEWEPKRILIQMADTDLVVPNSATRVLSAVTEEPIHEYHAIFSNHAFLLDPLSIEGERARDQAIEFLLDRP